MSSGECPEYYKLLVNSLKSLKARNQLCDVTIIAGDEEIKVHRLILVAASKYFEAMFFNDTQESKTGIFRFPSTPKDVVKQCIEFIYSGKVEYSLKNITETVKTTDMLGLGNMTELYVTFFSKNIDLENSVEILSIAHLYDNTILKASIQTFFSTNFSLFVVQKKYVALELDCFTFMLSLANAFSGSFAELKVTAIMNWIKHDRDERRDLFVALFQTINASTLSKEFIKTRVMCEDFVSDSKECLRTITDLLLNDAKSHKRKLTEDSVPSCSGFKLKCPKATTGNPTGDFNKKSTNIVTCNLTSGVVYRGDLKLERWTRVTELPSISRSNLDVTEYKGWLYLGDGCQMYRFDGAVWKRLWNAPSDFIISTSSLCFDAISVFNRCFGSGGYVFMVTGRFAVIYEISTAQAHLVRYYSVHGSNFLVASSSCHLYIMGGQESDKLVRTVSIKSKTSHSLPQMRYPRVSGVGLWFQNAVYAIGGGPKSVEFYNTITKQWQIVKNLEIDCIGVKSYCADKFYLFNGRSQAIVKSVEWEKFTVSDEDKQPTRSDVQFDVFCLS